MSAERAARAGDAGRGRRARCAPIHGAGERCRSPSTRSGSSRTTPRRATERGADRARRLRVRRAPRAAPDRGGAERPRARAGPLPQRPARRQLPPPARPRTPDRRLGVRGDGRPLLRPRATSRSTTSSARPARRRCSTAYFGRAARRPARLAALRLMRFMSDFREAMWGVVQGDALRPRLRLRRATRDEHFDRMLADRRRPRLRDLASRRRVRAAG